jgi:F-type H+-transporting ATPase subunit epsilon
MSGTFKFELVSPERILLSEDAEQVVLPGAAGDFAVLAGHAPVISVLRPGVMDVTLPSGQQRIYVDGGFAEVSGNSLTVLAEKADVVGELGADQIASRLKEAEDDYANATNDAARLRAADAVASLKALQQGGARH